MSSILPPLPTAQHSYQASSDSDFGASWESLFTADQMRGYALIALKLAQRAGSGEEKPVAWIDANGHPHRVQRERIYGLWNADCSSGQVLWSGTTFSDAVEAWRKLDAKGGIAHLTTLNGGQIASHGEMVWKYREVKGGAACPICESDTPHTHNAVDVETHHENVEQSNRRMMGRWTELDKRIAAFEAKYPLRMPLYAAQPDSERDAARYRFVRDGGYVQAPICSCEVCASNRVISDAGFVDKNIDAAMAAQQVAK